MMKVIRIFLVGLWVTHVHSCVFYDKWTASRLAPNASVAR